MRLASVVGDGSPVRCVDGVEREYVGLDAAASTGALAEVAAAVEAFLPRYSSVHRGAGHKSQDATAAYEDARRAALRFARRDPERDIAIFTRNTTESVNVLAHRLRLERDDVIVTTVVEHHANLLPWARAARPRYVECGSRGTFTTEDVVCALDEAPRPKLLAITGASNVTGWVPSLDEIVPAAHERGVRVFVDAAQLAPHRPLPAAPDFVAWSAHKMYAPYGTGVLAGPRSAFEDGDPFVAGGGAVDLVDLDEVWWTAPPEREEAGSPNVIGAIALQAAIGAYGRIGFEAIASHDRMLAARLHDGLRAIPRVRVLGDVRDPELPVASFTVDGVHHALVAARLASEHAIGVRHGCFCAHPYLLRLLGLSPAEVARFRDDVRSGQRAQIPGAVRASTGLSTSLADVDALVAAVSAIASGEAAPVDYEQDPHTGDFVPAGWEPAAAHARACPA